MPCAVCSSKQSFIREQEVASERWALGLDYKEDELVRTMGLGPIVITHIFLLGPIWDLLFLPLVPAAIGDACCKMQGVADDDYEEVRRHCWPLDLRQG